MTSPVSIPAGHALVAADFDAYENATGAWSTWTPTLGSLTVGSGTLTTKYRQVGKTVDFYFRFIYGVGSAVGTDPNFSPPAAVASTYPDGEAFPGGGSLLDASTARRLAFLQRSGTSITIKYLNATPTDAQITSTAPWTWGASDSITCWGTYEAA